MKHHIVRLSALSLAATAGLAIVVLAVLVTLGFIAREWRPDWTLADSAVEAMNEAPTPGKPAPRSLTATEAYRDGGWIWALAVAIPFAWYLLIWSVFGRDPLPGAAFPRFCPPDGLSPATLRQTVGMGFDEKAMAAELLSLAVRGHVRVIRTKRGLYGLRRTGSGTGELTAAERHLMTAMFRGVTEIVIGRKQGVRLRVAMEALRKHLEDELEGPVYHTNVGVTLTGVTVSGIAFVAAVMSYRDVAMQDADLAMAGGAALSIVIVNVVFFVLMKAPTALGREVLDKIAGFRMFLATAEHERVKMADAPEMTDHLYADYLPHALALDLELVWSDQFSFLLKRAIPDPMDYEWYASGGGETFSNGLVGMANALGAAIANAFEKDDGRPE